MEVGAVPPLDHFRLPLLRRPPPRIGRRPLLVAYLLPLSKTHHLLLHRRPRLPPRRRGILVHRYLLWRLPLLPQSHRICENILLFRFFICFPTLFNLGMDADWNSGDLDRGMCGGTKARRGRWRILCLLALQLRMLDFRAILLPIPSSISRCVIDFTAEVSSFLCFFDCFLEDWRSWFLSTYE